MASIFRASLYVPQRQDEETWLFEPVGPSKVLLAALVVVAAAPFVTPQFRSGPDDDALWGRASTEPPLVLSAHPATPARWNHVADDPAWAAPKRLGPIFFTSPFPPLITPPRNFNPPDDTPGTFKSGVSLRLLLSPPPAIPARWSNHIGEDAPWSAPRRLGPIFFSSPLPPIVAAKWNYTAPDDTPGTYKSSASLRLLLSPAPALPARWAYNTAEDAPWTAPGRAYTLYLPVPAPFIRARWNFNLGEEAVWSAEPPRSLLYLPAAVAAAPPFVSVRWNYNVGDIDGVPLTPLPNLQPLLLLGQSGVALEYIIYARRHGRR